MIKPEYQNEPYTYTIELAKIYRDNQTQYLITDEGNFELFFTLSKESFVYKNFLGKFIHTGFKDSVQFFDQTYSNVYQVYWLPNRDFIGSDKEPYWKEKNTRLIWLNENFEILRLGIINRSGYYRVFEK